MVFDDDRIIKMVSVFSDNDRIMEMVVVWNASLARTSAYVEELINDYIAKGSCDDA